MNTNLTITLQCLGIGIPGICILLMSVIVFSEGLGKCFFYSQFTSLTFFNTCIQSVIVFSHYLRRKNVSVLTLPQFFQHLHIDALQMADECYLTLANGVIANQLVGFGEVMTLLLIALSSRTNELKTIDVGLCHRHDLKDQF